MKKTCMTMAVAAICVVLSSCGGIGSAVSGSPSSSNGSVLGGILSSATSGQTISGVIGSVLGIDKPSEKNLVGTWKYSQPGVAFTSENKLASAGGEAIATHIKTKLQDSYSKVGFSSGNTRLTLNADKTFTAQIAGKSLNGTWTYEANDCKLTLKTLLLSLNCYAKKTGTGMSFLMESKKMLTLLQTAATLSGNSTLQGIGDLSQNYDGVRIGFDMSK